MSPRKPSEKPTTRSRKRHPDFASVIALVREDASRLRPFVPLEHRAIGPWDPKKDAAWDEVPGWAEPIVAYGKRTVYELEDVPPDDVRHLDEDLRTGVDAFDHDPERALVHFATGAARILPSLEPYADGVVWWLSTENRPFLRALQGVGLCWWRLDRVTDARALFEWMLWLNPNDNQGVRMLLDEIARGRTWAQMRTDEATPQDTRRTRPLAGTKATPRRRGSQAREWAVGVGTLYVIVNGDGGGQQPDVALTLDEEGRVRGSMLGRPGAHRRDLLLESFEMAMARPLAGGRGKPTIVRVADAALAEVLRVAYPEIEIRHAPTPEVSFALASMNEHMSHSKVDLLRNEIPDRDMSAMFEAAAVFYRAAPWKVLAGELSCISVTMPALALEDAALSVMGEMGEEFGFVLFSSIEDFERYIDIATSDEIGGMPPHLSLSFDRAADVAPRLRKEVSIKGWEVASSSAYPSVLAFDAGLVLRPLEGRDVLLVTALALGLTALLRDKKSIRAAQRANECLALAFEATEGLPALALRVPF